MDKSAILIITNNPMVQNINDIEVLIVGNNNDNLVYYEVLNYISQGHSLLSHPLAGSLKPNQNPYRSILVSKKPQEFSKEDYMIIENCLSKVESFSQESYACHPDFKEEWQMVDYQLVNNAIDSLCKR